MIKELIIHLIVQDMRHFQLITRLEKAGFDSDMQMLSISTVVAALMGIPNGDMDDCWLNSYMDLLELAAGFEMEGTGKNLQPLAELCYNKLERLIKKEWN